MTRRPVTGGDDLALRLAWLRVAVRDRRLDVRLILEGLLDVAEALVGEPPGPPP